MMDRNNLHLEITSLAEKITFLNDRLSNEQKLHPVEMDLLAVYGKELNSLILQLGSLRNEFAVVHPVREAEVEIAPSATIPPREEKIQSPQVKSDDELKLHQHISAKAETSVVPENHEEKIEREKETALPEIEIVDIPDIEEISVRKKTEVVQSITVETTKVSLNDRFKSESKPLSDRLKSGKKNSLKELFDLNERYSFIAKLFGGSADKFNKTMHDLGKCATREEAALYIKNAEEKFAWQDQQAVAARFTEQVLGMMDKAKTQ